MNTPILILTFNRPDLVKRLIDQLEQVKPKFIYVSCDGPRNDSDREKIAEIKSIINNISWNPTVKTFFREKNLKITKAIPSGLDWFFSNVDEGIILEDDCMPGLSFFKFCETNLEYYRNDSRILSISGNNIQPKVYGSASYYFSRVPHIWGWATWKRAWSLFDIEMIGLDDFLKGGELSKYFVEPRVVRRLGNLFKDVQKGDNVWDFKFTFMHFKNKGYSIIPNLNLVTNVGFDNRATHPVTEDNPIANLKVGNIHEIVHPQEIVEFIDAYTFLGQTIFKPNNLKSLIIKSFLYSRKWIFRKLGLI